MVTAVASGTSGNDAPRHTNGSAAPPIYGNAASPPLHCWLTRATEDAELEGARRIDPISSMAMADQIE